MKLFLWGPPVLCLSMVPVGLTIAWLVTRTAEPAQPTRYEAAQMRARATKYSRVSFWTKSPARELARVDMEGRCFAVLEDGGMVEDRSLFCDAIAHSWIDVRPFTYEDGGLRVLPVSVWDGGEL